MNSRSDREEVLTAVMSAPKLPYNLVFYDRCGHCFVLSRSFFLFVFFFGSCYWSLPMNSRSDREEVLTAVTSVPKLLYNKDDRDKRMRMYLSGL
jgi:hypothetical protein